MWESDTPVTLGVTNAQGMQHKILTTLIPHLPMQHFARLSARQPNYNYSDNLQDIYKTSTYPIKKECEKWDYKEGS